MKPRNTIIFTLLGILLPVMLWAQKPNYTFKSIDLPEGLNNGTIQAIFEDSFGFIWIGTHNGVQRYDGKSYVNYFYRSEDTTGLAGNYINGFCEDGEGNIWIASVGGLSKYDRKSGRIYRSGRPGNLQESDRRASFQEIMMDPSEGHILWIISNTHGLLRYDILTDSYTIFSLDNIHEGTLTRILPYPGDKDKLLLGGGSLLSYDIPTGQFEVILQLEEDKVIPDNRINDIVIDPEDPSIIWLATGDFWGRGNLGGLVRYNLESGEKRLFTPGTSRGEMQDIHLLCVYADGPDKLWIGTRYHGILLYLKKQDIFYGYKNNEFDRGSFVTSNSVRSILKDRSGTVWFGTWGDGISQLSPAMQKFTWFKHLPGEKNSLPGNSINSFAEDKHGNIWIATEKGGISKFNPKDNSFENHFQEFAAGGENPTSVLYLFYDSRENLWIATHDNALYRYDPETGVTIHYTKGNSKDQVSQNRISAVTEIMPGEILISTYGGGLNVYRYSTDSFIHYMHDPGDSTSIPDNQVWMPFMGPDGNYYFSGNSTAGLIQFDPVAEDFKEIFAPRRMGTGMMPCKLSDNEFVINEISAGLSKISFGENIRLSTILDDQGNPVKNVECLLKDDDGKIWLGTGIGLIEFDPRTGKKNMYGPDDGLQGYAFNRFAAFRASTGEMYFGGRNGFNVFNPEKIKRSDYEPPVVFTVLRLFQEVVDIGEGSPLEENISITKKLVFKYSQNDFSLSFAALDFSNPEKIRYKYFLENHDNDWIDAGQNNTAGYTNMDPGKYTLQVLATNSDGIWNQSPKTIQIVIRPPWWQTWWAFVIYGLVIIASILAVDRYQRSRLLEKERAQTREKELAQAKEIEKAYEELKVTQKQLIHSEKMASLGELTAGIAHEIQNPLNFVNNFSEVNLELTAELREELKQGHLDEADALAQDIMLNEEKINFHGKRADGIVKSMLQHSRSSNGEKVPTDINALADEYLRLSYHGLRAKDKSFNAEFRLEAEENLPKVNLVPQDVGRVFLNLINNAFYAVLEKAKQIPGEYKPEVVVITKKVENNIVVRIVDNGNGIPEDIKDKIFQPFFTTKPAGEGTGLGLSLSYDIITKGLGGELKVSTIAGKGTEFIIVIPNRS